MNGSTQRTSRAPAAVAHGVQPESESDRQRWEACEDQPLSPALAEDCGAEARRSLSESQMGWLVGVIENQIIPRLLEAHADAAPLDLAASMIDSQLVADLAALVLANDVPALRARVQAMRDDGVVLEAVFLRVLAPVARHLGEMWDADLCDFTQVTVGLWRLQQLMYELSPAFQSAGRSVNPLRRALLVPVPGSQHTLGLFMVAEFFRHGGWDVWGDPAARVDDLVQAVRGERFDIVGFSVGTESHLDQLSACITAIRKASANPAIKIMVGGPAFTANPELAVFVGADATAADAEQAVALAERLVA
jgi:methanogenic corrinoid protein MtbC1